MIKKQSLKAVFYKLKGYYKDDYEKIKYDKKMVVNIRITDDIKKHLKKDKKVTIEKILEKNIFVSDEFYELNSGKKYKTCNRMWVELNYATVEKLLELIEKYNEKEKNRIINAILDNYFSNLCSNYTNSIDQKYEMRK